MIKLQILHTDNYFSFLQHFFTHKVQIETAFKSLKPLLTVNCHDKRRSATDTLHTRHIMTQNISSLHMGPFDRDHRMTSLKASNRWALCQPRWRHGRSYWSVCHKSVGTWSGPELGSLWSWSSEPNRSERDLTAQLALTHRAKSCAVDY